MNKVPWVGDESSQDCLDQCFVYWIRLPEHVDIHTQGYIGISNNPKERLKNHIKDSRHKKYRSEFKEVLQSGNYLHSIIFSGTRRECLNLEYDLRPNWFIGWNMAPGGNSASYLKRIYDIDGVMYSMSELSIKFGIKISTLEGRLYSGKWTVKQSVGIEPRPKKEMDYVAEVEEAIYLLENSPITLNEIGHKTGLGVHVKDRISCRIKLPQWLYSNFELLDRDGIRARRVPRLRGFDDMDLILDIEDDFLDGNSLYSLSQKYNKSRGSLKNLMENLENANYC